MFYLELIKNGIKVLYQLKSNNLIRGIGEYEDSWFLIITYINYMTLILT